MLFREELEKRELTNLAPEAAKAIETKGRKKPEPECAIRTCYQRDRDRIIHSKAFRRLMHKTQVFLKPEGDHYRTRLTHTIEVTQVSRTIARALNLNEDLTEAIALGHDLGHTPFGHSGERVLNIIHEHGFKHNEQSLRVVDVLENRSGKQGMNLTDEVRDGILNHTGKLQAATLEGQIVNISDRIAYINHDIDDAIRSGVIKNSDIPSSSIALFGAGHGERIDCMVRNVIETSSDMKYIRMDSLHQAELDLLRSFMFENVYINSNVKNEADLKKAEKIIRELYQYFLSHPEELPEKTAEDSEDRREEIAIRTKDYIAGMTDTFAIDTHRRIFG